LAHEKRLAYLVAHAMRRVPVKRERLGDLVWPAYADAEHPIGIDPVEAERDRLQRHVVDAFGKMGAEVMSNQSEQAGGQHLRQDGLLENQTAVGSRLGTPARSGPSRSRQTAPTRSQVSTRPTLRPGASASVTASSRRCRPRPPSQSPDALRLDYPPVRGSEEQRLQVADMRLADILSMLPGKVADQVEAKMRALPRPQMEAIVRVLVG
jgi:hypothetical protein